MFAALGLVAALTAGPIAAPAASPCAASPPAAGATLHGPALHVIDGRTLCLAEGAQPSSWVAVQLDDLPADAAWGALMAAAFSQTLDCQITRADAAGGPTLARCAIAGRPLGEILRDASVQAAAPAWRRHATPPDAQAARFAAAFPR